MKMKPALLLLIVLAPCTIITAQQVDTAQKKELVLSGFADLYYQYDFDNPANKERPGYIYNHKKHNQPRINLALLKASFQNNKWRAHLGLMAGDYPKYNLAAESDWARSLYEANIGYIFSDKFSIDAGILPSHIGFESAVSKDNWILCRSLLAENSPYYETGIKLNYTPDEKWSFAVLGLNGWQHIKDNNSSLAIGTQMQYKPNSKWLLNSSTFLGNEKPDSVPGQLRFFHNFYTSWSLSQKINLALFFDVGIEEKATSTGTNKWLGLVGQLQYKASNKISSAFRYEYYKDKTGVIVIPVSVNGFRLSGFSANIDWTIMPNLLWRNEFRLFDSPDSIFSKNNLPKDSNLCFLSSVAWWF